MTAQATTTTPSKKPQNRWGATTLNGKRRSVPHLVLGVVLVVACAGAGAVVAVQWGQRDTVLVLARSVEVGTPLAQEDLTTVSMATDTGLDLLPSTTAVTMLGRIVAFSAPAGTLLTRALLGTPQSPPAGEAVVAIAVSAGQWPPSLARGARVALVAMPTPTAGSGTVSTLGSGWTAVVVGIVVREGEKSVLSLQLGEREARAVAAIPAGQVSVTHLGGGR